MIRFADLLYSAFFQSAKNAAITKRASITLITFYSIRTSTKCIKTVITSETDNTLGLCIAYSKKYMQILYNCHHFHRDSNPGIRKLWRVLIPCIQSNNQKTYITDIQE